MRNLISLSRQNLPALFLGLMAFAVFIISPEGNVQAMENKVMHSSSWAVLGGYGESHPGWGETETRVTTIDLVVRRSFLLHQDVGSSWYRGNHFFLLELPVHILVEPDDSPMVGLNFLACYTFSQLTLHPYIFIGGGPVYVDADIPGMGADLNGNYQVGAGWRYPVDKNHDLLFEVRYHHISNAGRRDPNKPLNSAKFLIGLTF